MRVLTLVGARPQFIKASMISRALSEKGIDEIIIHSGQHYDQRVSQIFFDELELPKPHVNLQVGSATHAKQTGKIMIGLDNVLNEYDHVDCVIVYGDTNTTLAGALVAVKRNIPLVHIEAGLRSFNTSMPEEVNRIVTDRISTILFCPTETAVNNLKNEGMEDGVFLAGDVMYDATMHFSVLARRKVARLLEKESGPGEYYVATIHRASNTDNLDKLSSIMEGLKCVALPVLLPLHPRTQSRLKHVKIPSNIHIFPPVGYLQMLLLIQDSKAVITDSGGLQKEAYWLKKPCITLREETEWPETLRGGWNQLVGANPDRLLKAINQLPEKENKQDFFGLPARGEKASIYMADILSNRLWALYNE